MQMRVVVVGNGVAGIEAAMGIRHREADADITIVSEESDHFFSRTALMYVLSGQMSPAQIEPYERDLYERMGFARVRARAVGLDAEHRELCLVGDRRLAFDVLIIACGSRPRPPPWQGHGLLGVGHFVTLQDLEWLERELHGGPGYGGRAPNPDAHLQATTDDSPYQPRPAARDARQTAPRHPVVIGGGLIGVEVVETCLAAGLSPRFLIREEWFWPIALDAAESRWIADEMRGHGVHVDLEHNVEGFEGDGDSVARVVTDQQTFDADLVVVAIGVVPNTDWLEGSGIERDKGGGIVVKANLETSIDGVFACGDCASVRWFNGQVRPEQLWYTARDQGRVAARAALGDPVGYSRGIWYNSAKLMDIEYTTAGLVNMDVEGEQSWYLEETGKVRSTTRVVTNTSGEVIGFNLLGRRWDHNVLIDWIEQRRKLPWVLKRLNKARFDTEFVPRIVIPKDRIP